MYDPSRNPPGLHSRADFGRLTSFSGTVVGSDGRPVSNARVELRNLQTGSTLASGYTTSGGSFEFENIPPASYEVSASQGLSEARERVTVSDTGNPVTIRLGTSDAVASQADGEASVSVAEYKVPKKARDAYHKASAALAKQNSEEAAKQLAKALEIYPDYAAALTLRGVMSLDANHSDLAIADFDKAIHADPSYALAYTAMAAVQNQLTKFDEALRSAERSVTLSPRSWQPYFEMAKASIGKADYQHALQQLAKAQTLLSTDYAPLHLVRAHVMLALKNYNDAMNELQAFLALAPQDRNSPAARETLEKVKAFTAAATAPAVR
jgi:Flp pilus assembly protein TadD